jgi:Spy/CpxP family protein refolding chaperone
MKTKTLLTHMMVAAGLLAAVAFQAVAQAPGGGGGGGGMGVLTQDQRAKLRESMQASQADLTALNQKLVAAQKDALNAALAKNADEKTIRAKVEVVAKIQTDIAMLRFKAVKEIASTITDEQKTQMQERPSGPYNMLLGGFGGMGGMGGPGGRRGGGGGGGGGGNQ